MTPALHAKITNLITAHRYRATFKSDLAEVIEEWSSRASLQAMLSALQEAIEKLEEEE